MEEKAHLEALKVESRYLAESQKRDIERRRLEMEADRSKVQKEIEMAEARAKVYEDHVGSSVSSCSNQSESALNVDSARKPRDTDEPVDTKTCSDATSLNHLNDLCNFLKTQSAPQVDMDYFYGNPLNYQYFMSLFEELIEKKISDPFGKLARLIKYTRGEAKELIQHCSQMPQPDGYHLAKELLEKEYGDPHKVTSAYMKELKSWKTIRAGDVRDFKRFYRFLLKCHTNRKGDVYLRILDNPETLSKLQSKLPLRMQERWTRKAVNSRETSKKELDFSHFLEFVRLECTILDDPVYSQHNEDQNDKSKYEKEKEKDQFKSNEGGTTRKQTTFATQIQEQLHEACLYCADRHDIDSCEKFLQLPYKQRKSYLYQQKFCFHCYGAFSVEEHGFDKCKGKRKCTICSQAHPTAMHRETNIESSRATHTQEESVDHDIGMPILPVRVYHSDNPERSLVVYAMLDNCSSGVFLSQDCANELDLQTSLVNVLVKTVIGVQSGRMNRVKKGLMVEGVNEGSVSRICLPKTYCKDDLSIEYQEIVNIDDLKKWDYLSGITHEFHRYKNNIPIALIIGSNCPKAVEQLECISSRDNGPYAFRTRLGWCVAGPCREQQTEIINCNRISVRDISMNATARHQFVVKGDVQDMSISEQLKEMYTTDFNENNSEKRTLSVEDRKFITIMETGKLINNHHYLPLPLRNGNPKLPNNRCMAVKRINSVQKRMLRNDAYRADYIKFMSELIERGHAKKVDSCKEVSEGLTWYVPHHGVYHPKTGKFRVVMDCGAVFKNRSLNAELIPGPDNTNLLLGVLLRFRQHTIPYMGDLKQMFYQIYVPESQRNLLRFVWWPDGDTSRKLEDYEMCVHLFGAVCSPSVAGYALRKTAVDNADRYGEEAANAVFRNFYVDDLCKSEDSVRQAVSMIGKIDGICAAGGFNLTKLISSNREVLKSIPLEKRAPLLQVRDMSSMGLPIERALGVVWNVQNDTLGFRIQFSDKELSRRVLLSDVSSIYDPDGRCCAFVLPGKKVLQEITAEKED